MLTEGMRHFVENVNDLDTHINRAERAHAGLHTPRRKEDNGLVPLFAYLLMSHMCMFNLNSALMSICIAFSKSRCAKASCNVNKASLLK